MVLGRFQSFHFDGDGLTRYAGFVEEGLDAGNIFCGCNAYIELVCAFIEVSGYDSVPVPDPVGSEGFVPFGELGDGVRAFNHVQGKAGV